MRRLLALVVTLALAQCAHKEAEPVATPTGYVVIGVAESAANTQPEYLMLWRKIDPVTGGFAPLNGHTSFEAHTNDNGSLRVRGVPGEFEHFQLEPGIYALDSVFAILHDQRVNYFAQGVVTGPERPSFEVQAGDELYLGIWELNLDEAAATARMWRLEPDDARAVIHASADSQHTALTVRQTEIRSVTCAPHRTNDLSQRQVC
ncbi:MAG: hypothetical protein QM759_05100 [Terricaulis sp.]